ncbi:MAG: fimbrillin family protein [Bacteroides sp.]|nr:fimbrillin family protein [Bacteroides sp.]
MKPILPFLLACLLHSCSPDSAQTEPETRPARPICLSATIDGAPTTAATRVVGTGVIEDGADNAKTELQNIHFLRKDAANTDGLSFKGCTPISASRDASGNIAFTTSQDYNPDGNNTYFVAYWPAEATTETNQYTWTISGDADILITEIYNAGSYTAPITTPGLTFSHALAQLKVVLNVAENTSLDVAKAVWGKITKIELTTSETMTYTYATNELTYGMEKPISLYKNDYTTKFENQTYELVKGNTDVIATGMFPPSTGTTPIKLKVTGSTNVTGEAEVQLMDGNTSKGFESGKTHTVALSLGANEKEITVSATTIEEWTDGGTSNAIPDGEYYSVGDYFQKDNNILGIVCQLDQTIDYNEQAKKGKKGLIISPNEPTDASGNVETKTYTDAVAWCTKVENNSEGNRGWRLPTAEELQFFWTAYSAAKDKWNARFSALTGGTPIVDNAQATDYWTSDVADVTGATRKVRCVRRFDAAR